MPTKTWVVGEEVLAADFNSFVQKQVVATFANAAARDAAIPTPTEGMAVWVQDNTIWPFQIYRGGMWRPPPGTVLYNGTVALIDINNSGGLGVYDVGSIGGSTTFPFPTLTLAHAQIIAGFGGGNVNYRSDLFAFGVGTATTIYGPVQAPPACWASNPVMTAWPNASNAIVGYKGRVYYDAGPNIHTTGTLICQVVAQ